MNASSQSNDRPLQGQHAVVTGGGRGIGKAIASELARLGANLSLMGRDGAVLAATAEELRKAHGVKVEAIAGDLSVPQAIQAAFEAAAQQLGAPAILVNNAGIAHSAPFGKTSLEQWNHLLAVDLTGPFLCIQQVLKPMVAAGFGRIVNIAS